MARTLDLGALDKDVAKSLARSFQSGHVNFLIGSGASIPAIQSAGDIEQKIADLIAAGDTLEAISLMYEFLAGIQTLWIERTTNFYGSMQMSWTVKTHF